MIRDHRGEVRSAVQTSVGFALEAMGRRAVELVRAEMARAGVRDSGALMDDVGFEVGDGAVQVGNSLGYSVFVHEGTSVRPGRAYIRNALAGAGAALEAAAADGFRTP